VNVIVGVYHMERAKIFAHWIDMVSRRFGESSAYLMLPLVAITSLEVILRYVFNSPTIWAWDVNVQIQGALIILAGGYSLLSGNFVVVDIFVSPLSPKVRAWLDLMTSPVVFFAMGIMVWQTVEEAWHSWLIKEHYTSNWSPPLYPFKILVAIGIAVLFLQVISRFIHLLVTVTSEKKEESA